MGYFEGWPNTDLTGLPLVIQEQHFRPSGWRHQFCQNSAALPPTSRVWESTRSSFSSTPNVAVASFTPICSTLAISSAWCRSSPVM